MKSNSSKKKILIAAGGTGGHVFPALATAYALSELGCEVTFATDTRGEKYIQGKSFDYKIINSASPSGGVKELLKFAFKTTIGIVQSFILLNKTKADVAIGFGGYPSFPPLLAAKIMRKGIVLHEQNSVLGKVNAFMLKYTNILATSFEQTKYATGNVTVGNPVRGEITPQPFPDNSGKINVFITGGSQGAKSFSELFPDAFAGIENIFVTQQAKEEDIEDIKAKYAAMNIGCEVKAFFDDIDKKIAQAHLIICRSGSSTIAEVSVIGRPAVFIPLPTSADNHQLINAQALEQTKGAWVVEEKDLDKAKFNAQLKELLQDYASLQQAAENIKSFAKPDAAKNLAKLIADAIV